MYGIQRVSKFKEHDRNTVLVCLAVLRLPSVDSDIVIHYNCPAALAPASSSSAAVASVHVASGSVAGGGAASAEAAGGARGEVAVGGEVGQAPAVAQATAAEIGFRRMLSSLVIRDWGLFEAPDMPS